MMLKKWKLIAAGLVIGSSLLTACSSSATKGDEEKADGNGYEKATIRLAYNLPQDHHISRGVEEFAKKVTERSGGKVKVQVYPAGQLLSDKEMNQAVLTGGVEMGVNSSTLWTSVVPAMGIFDVPFALPTYEASEKALTGDLRTKLNTEMEKKGAKVLMYADYGYAQFANNVKPLKNPDDFKGLKIRSIGEIPSEMIKGFGAAPVFMGASEVYLALQRNTIDGATSGTTAMLQRKYDEVAKYLTICNYTQLEFLLTVNKKYWDALPTKTQELITTTADETEKWIRSQAKSEDAKGLEGLKKNGMEVYVVPQEDVAKWKEASKPAWDAYLKTSGALGKELIKHVENIQ